MKAVVYRTYGTPDSLELQDVARPTLGDNDVLIRVRAAGVNAADWHLLTATPWMIRFYSGLLKPKHRILGLDAAGAVEAVGARVTQLRPGDEVFGSSDSAGGFAEYMRLPERLVVRRPENVSAEEAAALPVSALTALQGLRNHGKIRPGHRVLVIGASGGVGTFAVQIAKSFGTDVTAVCSTVKVDIARSIGADRVVDYTREDVFSGDARYDLVLDIVGNRSLSVCRRLLGPEGIYVAAAGPVSRLLRISMTGGKRLVAFISKANHEDLSLLAGLLQAGKVKPVIDRRYPLEQVPEALRYIGEGHAAGKIVVTIQASDV